MEEKNDITILYDMPIHTDREISENRPDNREKKCTQNVVVKSSDKNAFTKVSEKLSKYKDLEKEITRMWQMETEISPVVVDALRVIKKGSEKLVREILGNLNLWERYMFYRRSKWQRRQSNPQIPQLQGLDPAVGEEIRSHELNIHNNHNNSLDRLIER